jgi:hypothetical protein
MARRYGNAVTLTMAACVAFALNGCVTAKKYRLAKADVPAAVPLGWTCAAPPADLTLESLIVYQGPGSWKRVAKWDEYVVKITNHGPEPLSIGSAALTDIVGQPQSPGTEPWQLEKISSTNWDLYGGMGLSLVAGAAGAVVLYGAAAATAYGSILAGSGAAASVGGAAVALSVVPILAVVDIAAVQVMNHNNKVKVQTEFDRRRLVLPVEIAPGASREGSFFFPMTPGPQRLVVKGRAGGAPLDLVLELKPLAGLHLKPAEEKTTVSP